MRRFLCILFGCVLSEQLSADEPLPEQVVRRLGSAAFRTPSHVSQRVLSADEKVVLEFAWDQMQPWVVGRDPKTGAILWRQTGIDRKRKLFDPQPEEGAFRLLEVLNPARVRFVRLEATTGKLLNESEPIDLPKMPHQARTVRSDPSGRWFVLTEMEWVNTEGFEDTKTTRFLYDSRRERDLVELENGELIFSNTGKYLVHKSQTARLIELKSGKIISKLNVKNSLPSRFDFSRDDRALIGSITRGGPLAQVEWNTESGESKVVAEPKPFPEPFVPKLDPPDSPTTLHFDAKGTLFALFRNLVVQYDPATGKELARKEMPTNGGGFARFSADGSRIALVDGEIRRFGAWSPKSTLGVFDVATGKRLFRTEEEPTSVMGFTLSADGKRLFSVHSGNQTGEGKILEWDVDDGKLSRTWADPSDRGSGYHTTVSPDGKTLVYSDADFRDFKQGLARLSLWRLDQLDRQKTPDKLLVNGDYASCIEFTQDSSRIVSVHKDQLIVWNREKQQAERIVQLAQQRTLFRLLTLRSDGKVLAVASSDGLIRVVDRETGKVLHDFLGHEGWIDGLALSPDGRWLVSSSPEAPIFVWKLK